MSDIEEFMKLCESNHYLAIWVRNNVIILASLSLFSFIFLGVVTISNSAEIGSLKEKIEILELQKEADK